MKTPILSDFDTFGSSQQPICALEGHILVVNLSQDYNQQFSYEHVHYFSFFFIIFLVFSILVIFVVFFNPPGPWGYPDLLAIELISSQELLRCQPASKNCFKTTFFHAQNLMYGHFDYFRYSWGVPRGLQMVPNVSILSHTNNLFRPSPKKQLLLFGHKKRV